MPDPAMAALALVLLGWYAVLGAVTFVAYGRDKAAARQGRRRTRESTLHTLSLAGGWPGALAGRSAFRHKTRKRSFRVVFWCTVVGNCALLMGVLVLVVR